MNHLTSRRRARPLLPALASAALMLFAAPHSSMARPITVADGIHTARPFGAAAMDDWNPVMNVRAPFNGVLVSPDGARFVLPMVRGDLARNGNWLEVLSGSTRSLDAAQEARVVARLFMSSLGEELGTGTSLLTFNAAFNHLAWIDERRLAILWGDENNIAQIHAIDVVSGRVRQLTDSPTHVRAYAVSADGALLYAAQEPHDRVRSQEFRRTGFIVQNADAYSLLAGDTDGYGVFDWINNCELFFKPARGRARRIDTGPGPLLYAPLLLSIAPDGRRAIAAITPQRIPERWEAYEDRILQRNLANVRREGQRSMLGRTVMQLHLIDLETGAARPLMDAPFSFTLSHAWSPDGRGLALASAPTPLEEGRPAVWAANMIVDIESGLTTPLPLGEGAITQLGWSSPDEIQASAAGQSVSARRTDESWSAASPTRAAPPAAAPTPVRFELRQDANTPPRLFGVAGGRERMLHDLNPELGEIELAPAEPMRWTDAAGRNWTGILHRPLHAEPGRRYPLVIQTHGHAPETQFSLYGKSGPGLGTGGWMFAAQALAARGMTVITIQDRPSAEMGNPQEGDLYIGGYESAVAELDRRGLIDMERIGIAGYSRTGWHVEQALFRSEIHFAAAIIADRTDASYMGSVLTGWSQDTINLQGSPPEGENLDHWNERTAAVQAHRINAPLQLVRHSTGLPSILNVWELYSRLRYFDKPVELYVAPDIDHASHGAQNPGQVFALQDNLVDWFDFWLNGPDATRDEPPGSARAQRFERWQALRTQRCANPAPAWFCPRT